MKDRKRNHLSRIKILIWNIGIFLLANSIKTKYDAACALWSMKFSCHRCWWLFVTHITMSPNSPMSLQLFSFLCYFSSHIEPGRHLIKSEKYRLRLCIGTVINLWGGDLGWPWKSRPFEVSWRSRVFIRLLIRIWSFC